MLILKCPQCQVAKSVNHKPYGKMAPLCLPSEPFEVYSLGFIAGLPVSQGFDTLLTETDKYSKCVCLIPGKETWSAEQWGEAFFAQIIRTWQLPGALISDRESRFTGDFWTKLLEAAGVKCWLTASYLPPKPMDRAKGPISRWR